MQLIRSSFRVIRDHKTLIVFPAVGLVFTAVIFSTFFAVFLPATAPGSVASSGGYWSVWQSFFERSLVALRPWSSHDGTQLRGYVGLVALYLASMFASTFINVAFYHEIMKAMAGGDVSVRRGLAFACRRIRSILAWSFFAGAIGVLIQALSERFGVVGRFVFRLIGFAWSVAATFVIPVIIRDARANPIVLLERSASTIKKTWGEWVVGYTGIYLFPIMIVAAALPVILLMTEGLVSAIGVVVMVSVLVIYSVIVNLAGNVYRCALYIYATEGAVPEPYTPDLMDTAWKMK